MMSLCDFAERPRRTTLAHVLGLVAAVCAALLSPAARGQNQLLSDLAARASSAPLPSDPTIVQGRLPNGVRYVVKRHAAAPGQIMLQAQVGAGAINERDDELGVASSLARMLQMTAQAQPAARVVESLAQLKQPPAHDPVRTEWTVSLFTVCLPLADNEAIELGVQSLFDAVSGAGWDGQALERVRPVLTEQAQQRSSPARDLFRALLPRLMPGSLMAERWPAPSNEQVCGLTDQKLRDFFRRWYVAPNITVIAVGDAPVSAMAAFITKKFGRLPEKPRPSLPVLDVSPVAGPQAAVLTHAGQTDAVVEFVIFDNPRRALRTEADLRDQLLDEAAAIAIRRRLAEVVAAPDSPVDSADAWLGPAPGTLRTTLLSATGEPDRWREVLGGLCGAVTSLGNVPLTEFEASVGLDSVLHTLKADRTADASRPLNLVLDELSLRVARREPLLSRAQVAAIGERVLVGATPGELSARIEGRIDPNRAVFTLLLPEGNGAPSEDEVSWLIESALRPGGAALADGAAPPEPLLRGPPDAADPLEISLHPSIDVTSLTMSPGVRVHHRAMQDGSDRVVVVVTLASGTADELAAQRGLTGAAAAAFERPAARSRSGRAFRQALAGVPLSIDARVLPDRVQINVEATRACLETAFSALHLLLTEPVCEPAAFDAWKSQARREAHASCADPASAADAALRRLLYPGDDPRDGVIDEDAIQRLTLVQVQARLESLVTRSGIEIAVVGDASRDDVLRLASRYFAAIPPRPVEVGACHAFAQLPFRITGTEELAAEPGSPALSIVGAAGREEGGPRRGAALSVAGKVLVQRLGPLAKQGLTLEVAPLEAEQFSGAAGLFVAVFGEAQAALAAAPTIEDIFVAMGRTPPNEVELTVARAEAARVARAQLQDPGSWAKALAVRSMRGQALDTIGADPGAISGVSASDVASVMADLAPAPSALLRVRVWPQSAAPAGASPR